MEHPTPVLRSTVVIAAVVGLAWDLVAEVVGNILSAWLMG